MKNTMILQRAEVRIIACHQTGPAGSIKPRTISWERAGNRVRTDDLLITNQLLYQLSYAGISLGNRICAAIPNGGFHIRFYTRKGHVSRACVNDLRDPVRFCSLRSQYKDRSNC